MVEKERRTNQDRRENMKRRVSNDLNYSNQNAGIHHAGEAEKIEGVIWLMKKRNTD